MCVMARDEQLYEVATTEFSKGKIDRGLLAKARVLVAGEEQAVEWKYVELRVQQMKADKISRYGKASKDAVEIIAPALGRFIWHFGKTLALAILILGMIVGALSFFGVNI